ncbi:MAG: Ketose-bisphosphate aldolase, class-II [Parcubacteria group bacterium GW2011_GWA2_39_18]|nr:MAG: Ketose-bisphosphate aldolase, class-II [Parcubacteria group bacterium GW2011_GWA2_39_18]
MKNIKDYFEQAKEEHFAIGAFNAGNLETIKAIVQAGVKLKAPVIIESSHGETSFFGSKRLVDVIRDFREELNHPIFLNLDHAPTLKDSEIGIQDGYDLIHFDGSSFLFEENVKIAKDLVQKAHKKGLLVEGEIDKIVGSSSAHFSETIKNIQSSGQKTNPQEAADFIKKTGVDTFAAFIGNVHGFYNEPKRLDLKLLESITQAMPNTFLSLHGGSGIPADDITKALQLNVVKINVNSELRIAYRRALEASLEENPTSFAIYEYMKGVIEAVQSVVEEKIMMFGSEGKA